MKMGRIISLVSLVALIVAPAVLAEERANSVVVVTGMGSERIEPDRIKVSFTVGLLKKTPDEAVEAAAEAYEQVLAALDSIGFGLERVVTSHYDVIPQSHPKKRDKRIGYSAAHTLSVVTTDSDSVGTILDRIMQIEGTRIREIAFTSTKLDSIRRVALAEAVKNARADAAVMADAAGGVLGDLVEVTSHYPDNSTYRKKIGYERIALRSNNAIPTPLTPEKISVNISVLGKWRFVEKKPDGGIGR